MIPFPFPRPVLMHVRFPHAHPDAKFVNYLSSDAHDSRKAVSLFSRPRQRSYEAVRYHWIRNNLKGQKGGKVEEEKRKEIHDGGQSGEDSGQQHLARSGAQHVEFPSEGVKGLPEFFQPSWSNRKPRSHGC